jgi:hypothetical protein
MYGEDGWCRACGVPARPQCGDLVLQRKDFAEVQGAWVPNWQFDIICLAAAAADPVATLDVELRELQWHPARPGVAFQVVASAFGEAWFDPDELRAAASARHGVPGAQCEACGVWRWMPLPRIELPPLRIDLDAASAPVVLSPEWFGDGWNAYRELRVQRDLALVLAEASPDDFRSP